MNNMKNSLFSIAGLVIAFATAVTFVGGMIACA